MLISLPKRPGDTSLWTITSPDQLPSVDPVDFRQAGIGPVTLSRPSGGSFQIAAECLSSIVVTSSHELQVSFVIPSPAPNYGAPQAELSFTLSISKGKPDWMVTGHPIAWFTLPNDPINGYIGTWMTQGGGEIGLHMVSDRTGFPLDDLGITSSSPLWGVHGNHKANIGVFVDDRGVAQFVFMPVGQPAATGTLIEGIRLEGLRQCPLKIDQSGNWDLAPVIFIFELGPRGRGRTWSDMPWRALVNWLPLPRAWSKDDLIGDLPPGLLVDGIWNAAILRMMPALRQWNGALPWCPLPLLTLTANTVRPLLLFDVVGGQGARLRNVLLRPHDISANVSATLNWRSDDTGAFDIAHPLDELPGAARPDVLQLAGRLERLPNAPYGWDAKPRVDEILSLIRLNVTPDEPDRIAEWEFSKVGPAKDSPWINMGSLDICFLASDMHIPTPMPGERLNVMSCALSGQWTEGRFDIYPELTLVVPCKVRLSSGVDPASRGATFAEFDSASDAEEALHRDTDPLRFVQSATEQVCKMKLRVRCERGRNANVEMQLQSTGSGALNARSLYVQARPFTVAQVSPISVDPEAGQLIAIWSGSDAAGPQWRVPDPSLSFVLPPQTVGEEMERGNRFWDASSKGQSYIDAKRPLHYRFSPPTRLVLRSSEQVRRYEQNPNNVANVLKDAKVESFTTEMVYPVSASFSVSDKGLPDIRIAEAATLVGVPAVNLPAMPSDKGGRAAWLDDVYPTALASWLAAQLGSTDWSSSMTPYRLLRDRHRAAKASFSARLAQYHLRDSSSADGGLRLKDGLRFHIRGKREGAPYLMNPLPQGDYPEDLSPAQMSALEPDVKQTQWFEPTDAGAGKTSLSWGKPEDGSLRAGIIHTMEFPSELFALLSAPQATGGSIEALALSALGATGKMSASFDEGRTIFVVETQHGQLSRLVNIRIGRVALLWNKARHVRVYERSVVPGWQFADEQAGTTDSFGWPILRKMEEYVEPIEVVRRFDSAAERDHSRTDCIEACQFISERIFVNSAWGHDLGDGYEIPLWKPDDRANLYPKPLIALLMRAGGDTRSRGHFDEPDQLYFYASTARGTGDDPDKWDAVTGVDLPKGIARLPVLSQTRLASGDVATKANISLGNRDMTRRRRFDLAITSDGVANLQHGRSDQTVLAKLDVVSLARTQETSPPPASHASIAPLTACVDTAGDIARAADRLAMLARHLSDQLLTSSLACDTLKQQLKADADTAFTEASAALRQFDPASAIKSASNAWKKVSLDAMKDTGSIASRTWSQALTQFETDVAAQIASFQSGLESGKLEDQRDALIARLTGLVDGFQAASKLVMKTVTDKQRLLSWPGTFDVALSKVNDVSKAVNALSCQGIAKGSDAKAPAVTALLAAAFEAQGQLAVTFEGCLLQRYAGLVSQLIEQLRGTADSVSCDVLLTLKPQLQTFIDGIQAGLTDAKAQWTAVTHALTDLSADWLSKSRVADECSKQVDALKNLTDVKTILATLDTLNAKIADALSEMASIDSHAGSVDTAIANTFGAISAKVAGVIDALTTLVDPLRGVGAEAIDLLASFKVQLEQQLDAITCTLDRDTLVAAVASLQAVIGGAQAAIGRGVTTVIDALASTAAQIALDKLEEIAASPGAGLKFIKAIGDLPVMSSLAGNAWKAEYVKNDIERAIATSPYAVRLRDVAAGLNELGVTLPTRQVIDSLVPDVSQVDFNDIFRNVAGIDFKDFFARFRLDGLTPEQLKLSHGIDQASGRAWVKVLVDAAFAQEQTLFEVASAAVRVSKIALKASSDIEVATNGERRVTTDGSFKGNWGLDFGGTRLATFEDVTVRFNGSSFSFDAAPEKVHLNPALQFVQDYVKAFGQSVPPGVQIDKDARGMPVGARASYDLYTGELPPLGPLLIGPMKIRAGLGLRLNATGEFHVLTHVSVGAKDAPVFVQIGYLGGGLWLEAQAEATGRAVHPLVSVGLALGAMRSINLAGVAHGSFSVLLFVEAEISDAGGAFRAGLSIQGSARILGIASASVYVLLEVTHEANGATVGTGFLDVEVEICWCYTLRVHQATTHTISS